MQNLSIGFSPCPNDTFMFDAMINGKLISEINFDVKMADIEELNQMAMEGHLDITKMSYHAYAYVADEYQILDAGSALGSNCGPLLLANEMIPFEDVDNSTIAIPGKLTTANMLLTLAFPNANKKKEVLFSDIEDSICKHKVDLGLVIHENRFTYQQKGLKKIMDLGEYWETKTSLPIPLGAIVIRRSLPENIKQTINKLLKNSVQYAFDNPKQAFNFIKDHAQTIDEEVMYQHIDLYVNEYSLSIGKKGRASVHKMFELMLENLMIKSIPKDIFL